jgi:hypothetical protein
MVTAHGNDPRIQTTPIIIAFGMARRKMVDKRRRVCYTYLSFFYRHGASEKAGLQPAFFVNGAGRVTRQAARIAERRSNA